MRDRFRELLFPTLIVTIIASLYGLASANSLEAQIGKAPLLPVRPIVVDMSTTDSGEASDHSRVDQARIDGR